MMKLLVLLACLYSKVLLWKAKETSRDRCKPHEYILVF